MKADVRQSYTLDMRELPHFSKDPGNRCYSGDLWKSTEREDCPRDAKSTQREGRPRDAILTRAERSSDNGQRSSPMRSEAVSHREMGLIEHSTSQQRNPGCPQCPPNISRAKGVMYSNLR